MKSRTKLSLITLLCVVFLDQLSKFLIVKFIPLFQVEYSFFNDFLRIIHVRNTAIAFSFGRNFPPTIKLILFIIIPIIFLFLLLLYVIRTKEMTKLETFSLSLIIGGGFGNLIDRIFREGVVDFIDVKFYGLFGFERWPTFNVADSCVVIGVILMIITLFLEKKHEQKS